MASTRQPISRICNQKNTCPRNLKKKSRPLLSRMGERTKEVRPVAVWVEPELPMPVNCTFRERTEAVLSAEVEEERLRTQHEEKHDRLRRFQDQVKRRVKIMDQVKKRQQLEKSYRAVELERNIVQQTALAAEKSTSRRDRCSIRNQGPMIIHTPVSKSCHSYDLRNTAARRSVGLEQHTKQVHKFMNEARKNLMSRKVIGENFEADTLPGGPWKVSASMDHPAQRNTKDSNVVNIESEDTAVEDTDLVERHVGFAEEENKVYKFSGNKDRVLTDIQVNIPDIYPGVIGEEIKKQTVTQRAMFRRLFMDIEREQVKEVKRKKEHRKRIDLLKKEKEEERQKEEARAKYMIEPRDVATGETAYETCVRERKEETVTQEKHKRSSDRAKKTKETERFVDALRHNLREKIRQRNIHLPPLCGCGENVWDTNPDTCANNCVFYKNPKAYAKALQSLLSTFNL